MILLQGCDVVLLPKIPNLGKDTFIKLIKLAQCSNEFIVKEESLSNTNILDFIQYIVERDFLVCVFRDNMCYVNWANELRFDYVNHCVYLPYVHYELLTTAEGDLIPYNLEAKIELLHTDHFLNNTLCCFDGDHTIYRYSDLNKLSLASNITAKDLYKQWLLYTVYSDTTAINAYIDLRGDTPMYREMRKNEKLLYKNREGKRGVLANSTLTRLLTEEPYVHYSPDDLGLVPQPCDKPPNYYKLLFDINIYFIFCSAITLSGMPKFNLLGETLEYVGYSTTDMPTMFLKHTYKRDSKLPCRSYDFCIDINKFIN